MHSSENSVASHEPRCASRLPCTRFALAQVASSFRPPANGFGGHWLIRADGAQSTVRSVVESTGYGVASPPGAGIADDAAPDHASLRSATGGIDNGGGTRRARRRGRRRQRSNRLSRRRQCRTRRRSENCYLGGRSAGRAHHGGRCRAVRRAATSRCPRDHAASPGRTQRHSRATVVGGANAEHLMQLDVVAVEAQT